MKQRYSNIAREIFGPNTPNSARLRPTLPLVTRMFLLGRFGLHCGERFRYEYDFTADWTLDIRLEISCSPFTAARICKNHVREAVG